MGVCTSFGKKNIEPCRRAACMYYILDREEKTKDMLNICSMRIFTVVSD
jgi:hypothetical protein